MIHSFGPLPSNFNEPWRLEFALRALHVSQSLTSQEWLQQSHQAMKDRLGALDFTQASFLQDPADALRAALKAHKNELSSHERRAAQTWIKHQDASALSEQLATLLFGQHEWSETLTLLQSIEMHPRTASQDKGQGRLSESVLSLWMHLAQPNKFAWVSPQPVFSTAWMLLASPEGRPLQDPAHVILGGSLLYGALRALWQQAGQFEGGLLDVHHHLHVLSSPDVALQEASWDGVVTFRDVLLLAEETTNAAQRSEWRSQCVQLSQKMRRCCFDQNQPQDPYHGMELEDYARNPGSRATTLTRLAEYDARMISRLSVENAETFGIRAQSDESWGVRGEQGLGREEALLSFETHIKPMLREISHVGQMMLGQRTSTRLEYLSGRPYRSLDGQLLFLTLLASDPDWTWHSFLPVNRATELERWAMLIGLENTQVETFEDYLDVQASLHAALDDAEKNAQKEGTRSSSFSWAMLALWARHHELGQLLFSYLEPTPRERSPSPPLALDDPQDSEPVAERLKQGTNSWDELLAGLVEPKMERIARLLRMRHNVVLYGPPGTGKTVLSTQFATRWRQWQSQLWGDEMGERCVEQVTFHPSYGYEEFIEGFRPNNHPGQFSLQNGLLTKLALRAQEHPECQYLLLIDEFNRGDVARIFGELITLIESDKRSVEHARRRMLSQDPLWLPPNLYILATMNTADKSISLLDIAIRRRFAFEHMPPDPSLLAHTSGIVHDIQGVYLSALLGALNKRLAAIGIYPERWLGHSFLWIDQERVDDPVETLAHRFRLDIIPLVEEYCFADRRQMKAVLGALVDQHGQPNERVLGGDRFLDVLLGLIDTDPVEP